jgi:hypothetical protein
MPKFFAALWYSFPVQLLFMHLRNNPVLLGLWVFLFFGASGGFARNYGVMHVFLDPEYLGTVGFWSFFWGGLGFSMFLMAWNVTTYVMNSHHFPFLASLNRPFSKYCLNNAVIPTIFIIFYLVCVYNFQIINELSNWRNILWLQFGFLSGLGVGLFISALYFQFTNKDVFTFLDNHEFQHLKKEFLSLNKILSDSFDKAIDKNFGFLNRKLKALHSEVNQSVQSLNKTYKKSKLNRRLTNIGAQQRLKDAADVQQNPYKDAWEVQYYMTFPFRVKRVRNVQHYNPKILLQVFYQNHFNAFVIQVVSVVLLLLLGALIEFPVFMLPALASGLMFFSILTSLSGALLYWLRGWYTVGLLALFLGINMLTGTHFFAVYNPAYGLDYHTNRAAWTPKRLDSLSSTQNFEKDKTATIQILNNWLAKQKIVQKNQKSKEKPKMFFVCTAGGGMKAGVWTMEVMGALDSLSKGRFTQQTMLISGASGGMLGAAYYRELCLRKQKKELEVEPYDTRFIKKFSKDLLNPLLFTLATTDVFVPWQGFTYNGRRYHKDRGYMLEKVLNKNTDSLLDKTISAYKMPEATAQIPMMLLTPWIINDGRRLFISPQGISYMTKAKVGFGKTALGAIDGIEFSRFFAAQDAKNLRFLSALRMNATYPYILPMVHLPAEPVMEIMDAGASDNLGMATATRFADVFKDWIKTNTSGIVFVQLNETSQTTTVAPPSMGILSRFLTPLSVGGMFFNMQLLIEDAQINHLSQQLGADKVQVIKLMYHPQRPQDRASLSFHLTQREYEDILHSLKQQTNQNALQKVLSNIQF